ncbi:MAG TPA: bifunctional nuclease family protein [Gaiellaceae bacterium]
MSFEPIGKQPIVLLKALDEERFLPIWIGHPEAAAILMKLQGASPPRPMTHDLLTDVVSELKGEVVRVTVTELRENTYFAKITIVHDGHELEIDSRPSDAIALAVRCEAQIFAADDVVEELGIEFEAGDDEQVSLVTASNLADLDPEEFSKFIESVTPEEFASSLREVLEDGEDEDPDDELSDDDVAAT